MRKEIYITTSWDDGHPLDLRVAERLARYNLRGTFYVPMTADNGTMNVGQIRELGRGFEIGAHTLNHVILTRATEQQARGQIVESKAWLEDTTGVTCRMFCPPQGKYSGRHLKMVRQAGYIGLRSVELASLDYPRSKAGVLLMPTSVQAYTHSSRAFYRNAIKRAALGNLWRYIRYGHSMDWPLLVSSFLSRATEGGGVFHLWGHSWELQETRQWDRLDEALQLIGQLACEAVVATNGQICHQFHDPRLRGPESQLDGLHNGES